MKKEDSKAVDQPMQSRPASPASPAKIETKPEEIKGMKSPNTNTNSNNHNSLILPEQPKLKLQRSKRGKQLDSSSSEKS